MIIEKFLETSAVPEKDVLAADKIARRRARRSVIPAELVSHRLFPIGVGLWAAAVSGACTMVIHASVFERAAALTGLEAVAASSRINLAICVAGLAALIGFAIAALARREAMNSALKPNIASRTARRVDPINPVSDLGSESLDAPLDEIVLFERDLEADDKAPVEDRIQEPTNIEFAPDRPSRRDISLEEFGKLPGRDAVWVREEATGALDEDMSAPEPQLQAGIEIIDAAQGQRLTALEKLRAVPPRDLSLVQMVERFAAALREHQDRGTHRENSAPNAKEMADREAALAEALKALSTFSHRGFTNPHLGQRGIQSVDMVSETELELREALAKLQTLRGAA